MKVKKRAKEPLWVEACGLWDKLEPHERRAVVVVMKGFVDAAKERRRLGRLGGGRRDGGGEGEEG